MDICRLYAIRSSDFMVFTYSTNEWKKEFEAKEEEKRLRIVILNKEAYAIWSQQSESETLTENDRCRSFAVISFLSTLIKNGKFLLTCRWVIATGSKFN